MDHDALSTYLNDHLAGATLGREHARHLADIVEGTAFAGAMSGIAVEIDEDRDALVDLIDRLGMTRNPVKQATAWVAEKAGHVKFTGMTSGDHELGLFLALETMSLGVEGKRSLWTTLQTIAPADPELAATDLPRLIARAQAQRARLEAERSAAAGRAFAVGSSERA